MSHNIQSRSAAHTIRISAGLRPIDPSLSQLGELVRCAYMVAKRLWTNNTNDLPRCDGITSFKDLETLSANLMLETRYLGGDDAKAGFMLGDPNDMRLTSLDVFARAARTAINTGPADATRGDVGEESVAEKPTGDRPKPPATVNERMVGTIMEIPEAMGWNSPQWAKHLQCGKSSVVETATWKRLESARLQAKAERMKDRRRKPKASDNRRD